MAKKKGQKGKKETPKSHQLPQMTQIGENQTGEKTQMNHLSTELMEMILSNTDQASRKNFRQADWRSWHDVNHIDHLDLQRARKILGDAAAPYTDSQLLSRLYHLNSGKSTNAAGIVIEHYLDEGVTYQTGAHVEKWSKKNCSITTIYYRDIPTQVDEELWQVDVREASEDDSYYRVDGPALIRFYKSGQKRSETWYVTKGEVYRPDGYGQTIWNENGKIISQHWYPGRKDTERLKALRPIILEEFVKMVDNDGQYQYEILSDIEDQISDEDIHIEFDFDRGEEAFLEAILKLDITDLIMELLNIFPDPEGNESDMEGLSDTVGADISYDDQQLIKLTKETYLENIKKERKH
jgi:hypothetical protein